jgi:hypothetical protein
MVFKASANPDVVGAWSGPVNQTRGFHPNRLAVVPGGIEAKRKHTFLLDRGWERPKD